METIELWGECGDFAITPRLWRTILSVAQYYGWEPTGTLPPDPDYVDEQLVELCDRVFWDGRYYPGCLQRIIERDAQALAAALTRALDDIPDADAMIRSCVCGYDDWRDCTTCRARPIATLLLELSGPTKETVCDLIVHCRECAELWVG